MEACEHIWTKQWETPKSIGYHCACGAQNTVDKARLEYPIYTEHGQVRCLHCGHPLDGNVRCTGDGFYYQTCRACGEQSDYAIFGEV